MELTVHLEIETATLIVCEIEGNIDKYSKSFLVIYNNVKEFPNMLYRLRNYHDNRIELVCRKKDTDAVTEWLEQFGKVQLVEDCQYIEMEPATIHDSCKIDRLYEKYDFKQELVFAPIEI